MKAEDVKPGTFFRFKNDGVIYLKTDLGQAVSIDSGRIVYQDILTQIDTDIVKINMQVM